MRVHWKQNFQKRSLEWSIWNHQGSFLKQMETIENGAFLERYVLYLLAG